MHERNHHHFLSNFQLGELISEQIDYLEMDAHGVDEVKSIDPELGSRLSAIHSTGELSSNGEMMKEVGQAAMILTKVEMDIVCSSEKLGNLNVLMMSVATRESDLEASLSVKEEIPAQTVLEFDLLRGIVDTVVKELSNFFCSLHKEIGGVRDIIFSNSSGHMEEAFKLFEEKLQDCEGSLKQSQEQLDDMMTQSADLEKSLSFFWNNEQGDYAQDAHVSGRNQYLEDRVHMQTGELQRNVLRLLEKSLARELDLDMKLNEAIQIEEELKLKLHTSLQEASYFAEEATDIWAQCLEAENVAVVLMGISKDLLGQLQMFHFNLNSLTQNRDQLRSNTEDLTMQLEGKIAEINLQNTEVIRLKENIEEFEGKLCAANCRAETAEAKCKILEETNSKLYEELNHLKETSSAEKESVEEQLNYFHLKLQHTLATEEANQENQTMLNCMVGDMENLIKDLKSKVLNAECRADGAEAKCLVLSESNAELNDEVNYLRNKLEVLEASVHETNKRKVESAKSIEIRAKDITSLVMQLAVERDHLHEQLLSLVKENKALVVRFQMSNKGQSGAVDTSKQDCLGCSHSARESNIPNKYKASREETIKLASMSSEMSKTLKSPCEAEAGNGRYISEPETVRTIDARALNIKHLFVLIVALVVMVISIAAYSFQKSNTPF